MDENGQQKNCPLDRATPVLPQEKPSQEFFSLGSPVGTPADKSPIPDVTPYADLVQADFPLTHGSLKDLPTPEVSPEPEDKPRVEVRSPFSPGPGVGAGESPVDSPFSAASPGSAIGDTAMDSIRGTSPRTIRSPTSPSYSPAVPRDSEHSASPHYRPASPTYSPASPAYTPYSPGPQPSTRGSFRAATTSPAYTPYS